MHEELGDVVDHWTTLNEPYPCAVAGYGEGRHAPGAREGHGALAAAHHLLLGHGLAVRAMRAQASPQHQFGIVLNQSPAVPVSDSAADAAAAARQDTLLRRQFTDPLFGGRYAPGLAAMFAGVSDFSFRHDGDLETIGAPLDYLGVNYYYRLHVADAPHREPDPALRTVADIGVDTTRLPDSPAHGHGLAGGAGGSHRSPGRPAQPLPGAPADVRHGERLRVRRPERFRRLRAHRRS